MKTKTELYLAKIAGEDIYLPTPDTRTEFYLAKLAGMNVSLPEPVTERDALLYQIANEGLNVGGDPSGNLIVPHGTIQIIENGTHNVRQYAKANVAVPVLPNNAIKFVNVFRARASNTSSYDVYYHGGLDADGNYQKDEFKEAAQSGGIDNLTHCFTGYALAHVYDGGGGELRFVVDILYYGRISDYLYSLLTNDLLLSTPVVYYRWTEAGSQTYKVSSGNLTNNIAKLVTIDGQRYVLFHVNINGMKFIDSNKTIYIYTPWYYTS